MNETLRDAASRLLDCLYRDHKMIVRIDPALREAVELCRRAYVRDRESHDEIAMAYPVLELPDLNLIKADQQALVCGSVGTPKEAHQ